MVSAALEARRCPEGLPVDDAARHRLLRVLFVGVLMAALDIAIVGPALPAIQQHFGIDARAAAWIFTVFVLFNLVSTPLMAKLSDRWGRRRVYTLDVALFAVGSLVVAASPTFGVLLVGRALQAIGAGGIFPVASAVIGDTFPRERRGRALGLIGAVFGMAFLIGPILGGVLLQLSWQWLFLINLPIAAWLLVAAQRLVPDTRPPRGPAFDWAGSAVLAAALVSLALGLSQVDGTRLLASLLDVSVGPLLVVGLALLPVFWAIERRAADPIVRPTLLRHRQVRLVALFAVGGGLSEAAMVFVPSLAVASLGYGEATASFMLLPLVLALAVGAPTAGRLLDRVGSRAVVTAGLALIALGLLLFGHLADGLPGFVIAGVITGLGLSSLIGAPLRYILLNEAAAAERGAAQGLLTVFSNTGRLAGGALVGAVAASAPGGEGFERALVVLGVVMALLVVPALALKDRHRERSDQAVVASDPA
jgi:EmrB/QacA subfamily drug resistance transporter